MDTNRRNRSRGPFAGLDRNLGRLDWLLSRVAAVVVLLAMLLITADVVMRYVFNAPIFWVYDVVSLYIINIAVYLAIAEGLRGGRHIALGVRIGLLPARLSFWLRFLAWVAVAAFLCLLTWIAGSATAHSVAIGEAFAGRVSWPLWLQKGLITLGLLAATLRILVGLLRAPVTGHLPGDEQDGEPA